MLPVSSNFNLRAANALHLLLVALSIPIRFIRFLPVVPRYHSVMMKMKRVIIGVAGHFTTQFDYDEVKIFLHFKIVIRGMNGELFIVSF